MKRGDDMRGYSEDAVARMKARLVPEGDCLVWPGWRVGGYGMMDTREGRVYLHRLAYAAAHGGEIDGPCVLHTCDNPPCCNPEHLYVGDRARNVQDMVDRQRHATKITKDDVLLMRVLHVKGDPVFGQHGLARRFGISPRQVRDIVTRKAWKHVD